MAHTAILESFKIIIAYSLQNLQFPSGQDVTKGKDWGCPLQLAFVSKMFIKFRYLYAGP